MACSTSSSEKVPWYADVTDNIVGYEGDPENPDPIYESDGKVDESSGLPEDGS